MFYCGIDIAKYNHEASVINAEGAALSASISFANSKAGGEKLLALLSKHNIPKEALIVGMEATGHYWLALHEFLTEQGYCVKVINPIQSEAFRKMYIRKTKTDSKDAFVIAQVLRLGQYSYTRMSEDNLVGLRQLSRFRVALVDTVSEYKNRVIALLDQVFPEYAALFSDVFGVTSMELLSKYPTPEDMLSVSTQQLSEVLSKASRGRFSDVKAEQIKNAAADTFGIGIAKEAFAFEIRQILNQIAFSEEQVKELEDEISSILEQIGSFITTIPGIGDTLGAVILSEIGDINRFDAPGKLVAYAGLDVAVSQSGEFEGTKGSITKRGSPYLRRAIWLAASRAAFCDPTLSAYYQSLKARGKHHYTAIGAVARKMCNIIFTILKENRPYQPLPPEHPAVPQA